MEDQRHKKSQSNFSISEIVNSFPKNNKCDQLNDDYHTWSNSINPTYAVSNEFSLNLHQSENHMQEKFNIEEELDMQTGSDEQKDLIWLSELTEAEREDTFDQWTQNLGKEFFINRRMDDTLYGTTKSLGKYIVAARIELYLLPLNGKQKYTEVQAFINELKEIYKTNPSMQTIRLSNIIFELQTQLNSLNRRF